MADTFQFEIVTPAKPVLAEEAELVILPGGAGDFGVLPGHAALLSTLRPGTIEIRDKSLKVLRQFFVESGFAEVTPERCTVLAEEAMPVAEIGRDDAEARLKRAHDALMLANTLGVRTEAERDVRAAEAMLAAVESYEKGAMRGH